MEEELYLVSEDDEVVGTAPRSKVRAENLLHRGVGILVFNSEGQLYVHRRTPTKDIFPGMYDMFVGGTVTVGESYEQAAQREAHEELGVTGGTWTTLFTYLYKGPRNRCFTRIFKVLYDGPITHQAEEIDWGRFYPFGQVLDLTRQWPFVPDGEAIFLSYLDRST